ncbi:enoyl-CoA hydratase-related protein [Aquipseudomonas ullengensis]|uniref:Enoyl-CoA hydratase/isomerase family protein n=1 Tax=Aquipseudomonas ullengensis TaxID=2759166 RepID=A0A7W4QG69_9GAMM|nr:enoyl-CoA hydratase-related protein [Pseudomonas ullengensis]MBB2497433.1 enoyl-CoA hydratase/isomerase family protein [Pseudomonas ullengensis]
MSILLRHREGNVEVITLNRPERRNALSQELMEALSVALADAELSDEVRVIVLTATGDQAFCSGMDLKDFATPSVETEPNSTEYFDAFLSGRYPKPVIAAVNATAVAGGFELMMACDLAVVAEGARFGLPEVKRGLFPAGSGVLLPARIPLSIALELGLTGELINAGRAYQLGLVNRVVTAEAVLTTALELANRIAENGPLGVQATKKLMLLCAGEGASAARAEIKVAVDRVFTSCDAREGAKAFAEKRPPRWTGR